MSGGTHAAATTSRLVRPARSVAAANTWRGHLWAAVVAVDFFLVSNPLVFELSFFVSLTRAVAITALALVITLPWAPTPKPRVLPVVFLGWGLISAFWSISSSTTVDYWLQAFVVAGVAVAVASQVSFLVLTEGLVLGGVLVCALSWYAHLEGMPDATFLTLDGQVGIAGVGTNRNILAYTLVISVGALVAHIPRGWPGRLAWLGSTGLIVFTLYSADSTTGYSAGLAALVASVSVTCYFRLAGWLHVSRLRLVASLVGLVSSVGLALFLLAKLTGEDILTISGRLPIWKAAWKITEDQMVAGYGWGAVWAHPWAPAGANEVADRIYTTAGLYLSHGHNSLVDVLVELGLVGAALVLLIHGSILVKGAREAVRAAGLGLGAAPARLLLSILAAVAVTGISEPMSVIPLGWWTLLLLVHVGRSSEQPAESLTSVATSPATAEPTSGASPADQTRPVAGQPI